MNTITIFMWPDREWCGIWSISSRSMKAREGNCYDLKKDPHQLHNVCYDPAYGAIKKKYMDIMSQYMKQTEEILPGYGTIGLKNLINQILSANQIWGCVMRKQKSLRV